MTTNLKEIKFLILSAISSKDQLVIRYLKKDGTDSIRFVQPMKIQDEDKEEEKILCIQILPTKAYKSFKTTEILDCYRVSTKMDFFNSD